MVQMNEVDEYIDKYDSEVKNRLQKIRLNIKKEFPAAKELLSYGVPAFKLNNNIVMYAAFKKHLGLYPGPEVINHFKKELNNFETSKGAIKFYFENVDYLLIQKIVRYALTKK